MLLPQSYYPNIFAFGASMDNSVEIKIALLMV